MEDFSKYSNDKLMEMSKNLSLNFDKIKVEILTLHEILVQLEQQHAAINSELKSRV